MTEINWLGHACFLIKTAGIRILIDPFLGNPLVLDLCHILYVDAQEYH